MNGTPYNEFPSAEVDVDSPARFYMDHDGNGDMCLWLDYGPDDQFPVCLLREHSIAPELWDAAVRMLVVDDVSVEQVAEAIHMHAGITESYRVMRPIRLAQARAALSAFGAMVPPAKEVGE
jgi:hypothetical protein